MKIWFYCGNFCQIKSSYLFHVERGASTLIQPLFFTAREHKCRLYNAFDKKKILKTHDRLLQYLYYLNNRRYLILMTLKCVHCINLSTLARSIIFKSDGESVSVLHIIYHQEVLTLPSLSRVFQVALSFILVENTACSIISYCFGGPTPPYRKRQLGHYLCMNYYVMSPRRLYLRVHLV